MNETQEGWRKSAVWLRLAVMLLLFVMLAVAGPVLAVVSLAQWGHRLIHDRPQADMTRFGDQLAGWLHQTARYLAGSAQRRPFPFEDDDLPREEPPPVRPPAAPTETPRHTDTSRQPAGDTPGKSAGKKTAAKKKGGKKKKESGKKKSAGKKRARDDEPETP